MSVRVIAELGINHGGDVNRAMDMIAYAYDCGCDGVKVQSYRCADFLAPDHPDWEMFKRCEIWPHLEDLVNRAHFFELLFGTTPTSIEGVEEAVDADVDFLKNGSDFLLRRDLIEAMVATGIETWVSMGMATEEEIQGLPWRYHNLHLMHCTSVYPCPDEEANLNRLQDCDGFSDHTRGITAAITATALGAQMIEKHVTMSHDFDGPDHAWSADPAEMSALVREVRRVEKMLGSATIEPTPSELLNREKWRVREGTVRTG